MIVSKPNPDERRAAVNLRDNISDVIQQAKEKLSGLMKKTKEEPLPEVELDKSVLVEKIRRSPLFTDLAEENIEEMLKHMDTVPMRSGEAVVREGEEGDYYYLLVSGAAEVSRRVQGGPPKVVATLDEPGGFGEEALISNAKRNATVTMTKGGAVMRLSKDDFSDYVKDPMLTWFSPMEAQQKIAKGAKWIDVREASQARKSHLHGAISIPMEQLRDRADELDKDAFYICYCRNGRLSSTAAFLLRQNGISAGVLRGGLQSLERAGMA